LGGGVNTRPYVFVVETLVDSVPYYTYNTRV
jgi:hypothetical protein